MSLWAKWVEADQRFAFGLSNNGGVEITREYHALLLQGESSGEIIAVDEDGFPVLQEHPGPTEEFLRAAERSWRTAELSRYEWVATRHRDEVDMGVDTTLTAEKYTELLQYRQSLRDWPSVEAFPVLERRPSAPTWLAVQVQ